MLIDWFTVGAQAVNFLVLVWLLRRFLYEPILDAIDAREARIAAELADARAKQAQAQSERDLFARKNEVFDQQHAERLAQAKEQVGAEHRRLMSEARQAADDMHRQRREALEREQRDLKDDITRLTRKEVFAIARKTLGDLADASLEERMGQVFTCRLRDLRGSAKEGLAAALKTGTDPALVRSTFVLPEAQRMAIQDAIDEIASTDVRIRFEAAPTLVSGIELSANGQKVAWSIADYLATLERRVGELLQAPARSDPESP